MKTLSEWNKSIKAKADRRRASVISLRKQGKTWAEIGLMLGVSHQRAQQIGKGRT